jgi:hypothetical protein
MKVELKQCEVILQDRPVYLKEMTVRNKYDAMRRRLVEETGKHETIVTQLHELQHNDSVPPTKVSQLLGERGYGGGLDFQFQGARNLL